MALSEADLGGAPGQDTALAGARLSVWDSLAAVLARARNALFASPRFQNFAVGFAPAHATSNAYAKRLFDLAVGFAYSRVLHTCVNLGVLTLLKARAMSVQDIAAVKALPVQGARVLLEAAASLDILEREGADGFRLGPLGAALLGNPGVEAMIAHHSLLYEDLRDPVALLRGEIAAPAVAQFWPYGPDASPDAVQAYSALMAKTQAMIARLVLRAYKIRGHQVLMDIGGGEGVFAHCAAAAAPNLHVRVVDLPQVADMARIRFGAEGLRARAQAFGLDAQTEVLPDGADLITFIRVLHDHNDAAVLKLLRAARAALAPGGRLLIAEPMAETPGAKPMGAAYFGLYLTAMGQGAARSRAQLTALLHSAGFVGVREVRTAQPVLVRILVAR